MPFLFYNLPLQLGVSHLRSNGIVSFIINIKRLKICTNVITFRQNLRHTSVICGMKASQMLVNGNVWQIINMDI